MPGKSFRVAVWWRVGCTVLSIVVVQAAVFALALFPVAAVWVSVANGIERDLARAAAYSILAAPSYVAFAFLLMIVSPLASRLTAARAPEDALVRLADFGWPMMQWARAAAAAYLVRLVAGPLFCGSPAWSLYLRLGGARIGRGVYVNTVNVNDFNLLDVGDGTVIGADVHLSGHTVERGVLTTGPVKLGRYVTIGVGSIVSIGVDAGDGAQVGALTFVPKHMRLAPGGVYAGIPAVRLPQDRHRDGRETACPPREESSAMGKSPAAVA